MIVDKEALRDWTTIGLGVIATCCLILVFIEKHNAAELETILVQLTQKEHQYQRYIHAQQIEIDSLQTSLNEAQRAPSNP